MGVKSLSKFIEQHAPNSIMQTSLSSYSNMKLAIDVSIYMYRFCSYVNNCPVLCCMHFERLDAKLRAYGISPIYVFDGFPCEKKIHVIKKRQERQVKTNRRRITSEHFKKLKDTLQKLGSDFITANGDAEKACSWLCMNQIVDAVVSDDYDALAYGSSRVIRNINSKNITEINLQNLLQESQMTHAQFTTFCILSGCDFTPQGKKMGFQKAFDIIKSNNVISSEFLEASREFTQSSAPVYGKINSKILSMHVIKMILFVCCAKKILWIGK